MGAQDRSLRAVAQPFAGQVHGYNRNEQSDQTVDIATKLGDLGNLANDTATPLLPLQDNLIRILRPKSGHIIEAYFTMSLTTANAETNPYLKLSVWRVTSDTDMTALTPSEATINAHMLQLFGATTPLTNTAGQPITCDAINILPLIPQAGDTNYIEDCFTIGVHFYAADGITRATPSNGTGYRLRKFQIDLSATVI